jgi:acyl-[acyl carrier protein]--UDP-N-acetylglucosamine O-acyltransferase
MKSYKKTIYFQNSGDSAWEGFQYEFLPELRSQFEARQIKVDWLGTEIGDFVRIGNNVSISQFVRISDRATIGHNSSLSTSCHIGFAATVGNNVTMFTRSKVYAYAKVADNAQLAQDEEVKCS